MKILAVSRAQMNTIVAERKILTAFIREIPQAENRAYIKKKKKYWTIYCRLNNGNDHY